MRLVDLDEDFGEGGVDVHRLAELAQGGARHRIRASVLPDVNATGQMSFFFVVKSIPQEVLRASVGGLLHGGCWQ